MLSWLRLAVGVLTLRILILRVCALLRELVRRLGARVLALWRVWLLLLVVSLLAIGLLAVFKAAVRRRAILLVVALLLVALLVALALLLWWIALLLVAALLPALLLRGVLLALGRVLLVALVVLVVRARHDECIEFVQGVLGVEERVYTQRAGRKYVASLR